MTDSSVSDSDDAADDEGLAADLPGRKRTGGSAGEDDSPELTDVPPSTGDPPTMSNDIQPQKDTGNERSDGASMEKSAESGGDDTPDDEPTTSSINNMTETRDEQGGDDYLWRRHPSWLAYIEYWAGAVLLLAVSWWMHQQLHDMLPATADALPVPLWVGGLLLSTAMIIGAVLHRHWCVYEVTETSVAVRVLFPRRSTNVCHLDKLENITTTASLVEQAVNIGHVTFHSANEDDVTFGYVPNPTAVDDLVSDQYDQIGDSSRLASESASD